MAEHQVLVVLDAALAVEVDVEQLAGVECLRDAGSEVQPGHLFVADFRVHADELRALQRVDEREGVAKRRQQDVATGFVRLRLNREADDVPLVGHIVTQQVHGFAIAVESRADVLGRVILGTLAAAPHHEGLGSELCGEVEVAQHLAESEAANRAVVRREAAVLEDRCAEQVGGDHRNDEAGVGECLLEAVDLVLARGIR